MIEDKILRRELSKRIFANLGAVPNHIGKCGLTTREYLIDKCVIFKTKTGIEKYPIWAGVLDDHQFLLANVGDQSDPELILIYNSSHALKLIWDGEDCGSFRYRYSEEVWRTEGLLELLSMAAATELIAQNGFQFAPNKRFKEQYDLLISILEDDSTDDSEPATVKPEDEAEFSWVVENRRDGTKECDICSGLGIVEDPHHGHAFNCNNCGGTGKISG
jgi:hypothetical protein